MNDRAISNAVATGAPVVVLTGPDTNGLAQLWATTHAKEFPGGYLTVDLNDYRMSGGVALSEVMRQCLRALNAINPPMTFMQRAQMYRAYASRSRMVVALDNADQAAQVRPFVISNGLVIVSSRCKLGGLMTERAHFLEQSA